MTSIGLGWLLIFGDDEGLVLSTSVGSAFGREVNQEGRIDGQKEGFVFVSVGLFVGWFSNLVGTVGKKLVLGFSLGQCDGK